MMVLTAQIYAVYNRNRIILMVLGTLGFSIPVLDVLELATEPCSVTDSDENIFKFYELLSSIFQLIFAASVMVLSLYKAYGIMAMLGGIKNTCGESRFKFIWLIITEGCLFLKRFSSIFSY
ncbi:hypothetical protein K439DRAFT_1641245 [Ramaria rubella]|nr:hypothetical protein K439DRAFT_1641245 [Ramaria rubella]